MPLRNVLRFIKRGGYPSVISYAYGPYDIIWYLTIYFFSKSELPWQQEVAHSSLQYKLEQKKLKDLPTLDWARIKALQEKIKQEASERDGDDKLLDSQPTVPCPSAGSTPFDAFLSMPLPSAGPGDGRSSTAANEFKKSRLSTRERMSTNYIW